ncbi:CBO0543 family protein [Crassaminicella profunda]|uniref:CBO0543 family protein n=1 Tax=Crassaminicella profunda TaxID=1286698 RepID=UPI001CA6C04F|nr:CBO0543 family protein [Crassaminicella profunda]QZY54575.1 hypothetical protein K7H06_16265 [Crassaminicella profunda]
MNTILWTKIFFYGNIIVLLIIFIKFIHKERLQSLIPIGLFIAVENYTVEILGLHYKVWTYPLDNPGYPEVTIISSLIYFPIVAMLFYQYLSKDIFKNLLLILAFITCNMVIEIITLKTTRLFIYGKNMNLFIAFFMYLSAYMLIIIFQYFYHKKLSKRS